MKRALPLLFLIALLVVFRILGAHWSEALPGFEPLSAVFFCIAACVGWRWLWIPLVAWLLSYVPTNNILGFSWDWQMLVALGGFALAVGLGLLLRGNRRVLALLGGAAGAAVLFYFVTNIGAWALLPGYPKTVAGFVQAQTIGIPGPFPPAWMFLKNALLANVLFTGLFLLGQRSWGVERPGELAPVRIRR